MLTGIINKSENQSAPATANIESAENTEEVLSEKKAPSSFGEKLMRTMRPSGYGNIQMKSNLEIGEAGDKYEQEADAVADKVMRMPEEKEKVMKKPEDSPIKISRKANSVGGTTAPDHVEQGISSSKGGGQSLPSSTQTELGSKIGADFSGVKVHTDSNAVQMSQDIGAKAFTHGNDIYFNKGAYNPSSNEGKHLLAHELTHTVQQGNGISRQVTGDPPHKLVKANENTDKKVSDAITGDLANVVSLVKDLTGQDIGTGFGDTVRGLGEKTSKTGADNFSWHKTGRAIDFNQGLKWVIVEDPHGKDMYFKLYLAALDNNTKSKYRKNIAKDDGNILHYNSLGTNVYKTTLIDVTAILNANGFERIKAHSNWKTSYNDREWWHYENRDGLNMYQAFREIYTEDEIVKEVKKLVSERHKHSNRLHREGFPDNILKKIWDDTPITFGALSLYFSVGEDSPNIVDDMNTMKKAFKTLGKDWVPLSVNPNAKKQNKPIFNYSFLPTINPNNFDIRFTDNSILIELINYFQNSAGLAMTGKIIAGDKTHQYLGKKIADATKKK